MAESTPALVPRSVEVLYEASDLMAFNFVVWRRWTSFLIMVFAGLLTLNVGLASLNGLPLLQAINSSGWATAFTAILVLVAIFGLSPYVAIWKRKRSGWDIPLHFSFADDRMVIDHAQGKTELLWSAIQKVRRSGARIYMFTAPACAYIFPRRVFQSDAAFKAFYEDMSSRLRSDGERV